ncbi:E3 ubiquitin-protein ligase MARCHF7 isoform X2 [Astatotilapia calliptera]|uniref:E3 ubiquitin-protein ligase MARCHF7 isoform X2 n=1 Tax=Astatotilapia calliptera TaxID=8154 RepID=UPI000E423D22|nr:E3 ubiquitin-protein ligase MARCH7 isoform X2 [Astatotilapia calliptera]
MDSRSRRLPFCLSSSRSSYISSPAHSTVPSSSLGSSRLYSRETVLNNDRFPRASSSYKADVDKQSSRLLSSTRDYSNSDSRSSSWKLPSLTSSSRSHDCQWADSSLSSRSKLTDSEARFGMRSGMLNAVDDGDSKRAKLSSTNRGIYSRMASSSVTGSTYSSNGLSSGRDHTDRVTSTYAQGARPKETSYSPSSSSSTRESSHLNHHFSSSHGTSPQVHNFRNRSATRFSNGSSTLNSSQEQTERPESSSHTTTSYSSNAPWYATPVPRPEPTLPRPIPEGAEPESRRSTRRLLSRLFSRRSSQDSSSGSSSVRSVDDDSPSTGGESVDSDEGTRMSSVDPDTGRSIMGSLRKNRADLSSIQESNCSDYHSGLPRPRMASWREPGVSNGGGSGSSWLSSSFRGRCPPLLSRLRRHARDESTQSTVASEEGYRRPQRLLRRWDDLELKTSQDDGDDDNEEDEEENEEEEGAVGLEAFGAGRTYTIENETLPELEDASVEISPRRRVRVYENISVSVGPLGGAESQSDDQKEKNISSRDQEKLRKIKERLLLEDSDEEEGDLCRICQMGEESSSNPLIQPCRCTGSLQYVHQECIKRWLLSKIGSGANLEGITTCELCKEKLRLNIDNFDIQELYRTHVQSEYDEFISSGLYLVVLLHFCEQRFSDVLGAVDTAGLFNLVRILHEHMDNLEIPHGESDEEVRDNRPSIEFSDLDDDLEEEY